MIEYRTDHTCVKFDRHDNVLLSTSGNRNRKVSITHDDLEEVVALLQQAKAELDRRRLVEEREDEEKARKKQEMLIGHAWISVDDEGVPVVFSDDPWVLNRVIESVRTATKLRKVESPADFVSKAVLRVLP